MGKYHKISAIVLLFVSSTVFSQKIEPIEPYVKLLENVSSRIKKAGNPDKIKYEGSFNEFKSENSAFIKPPRIRKLGSPVKYELLYSAHKLFIKPDSIFKSYKDGNTKYSIPSGFKALPPRYKDNAVINVKYYDVEQGLSNSYLYDIHEDKNGMLWLATNGGGVNRFDGDQFIVYSEAHGLANNMVKAIESDWNGNLWFGTINGLSVFNGEYITNYSLEHGLTDNHILDLHTDSKHRIWIATRNGGVNVIENSTIKSFDNSIVFPKYVTAIEEDLDGNIWLGTSKGLYKVTDSLIYHYTKKNGLADEMIYSLGFNNKGDIYIGTNKGLDIIKDDFIYHYGKNQGIPPYRINVINYDERSGLFLGTNGGGLIKIQNDEIINLNEKQGLSNNEIQTIHKDRSKVYWMGTWGGGLNRYDGFSFVHFNKSHGLPTNLYPSIKEDRDGNIWLGSFGYGLIKYSDKGFYRYHMRQNFDGQAIWSMIFDNVNNLWIATDSKGLWRFNGESFNVFDESTGFFQNSLWSLLLDRNNDLWVGSANNGLAMYDGKKWIQYNITDQPIISLFEDKKGSIWALTWGDGVYMISGKMLSHFSGNVQFPADKVYNMFEDEDGYLWFATSGNGVVIYNGTTFHSIQKQHGLSGDIVYWIKQINDKKILIGTESGLTELQLNYENEPQFPDSAFVKTLTDTVTLEKSVVIDERYYSIKTYGIIEGFTGHDCIGSQHSVEVGTDGNIWIGTGNHLTRYNPETEFRDTAPANLHIKSIQIALQDIDWAGHFYEKTPQEKEKSGIDFDSIDPLYGIPQSLRLSHKHNQITFEFVAIDWKNPQKLLFKYKLEGLNNIWSYPTGNSKAMFTNLDPGDYVLKVKVINSDLVWSKPLVYHFTIKTPWWQTIWFQITVTLATILLITVYIRLRMSNLRRQKRVLEEMVTIRTKEIRNQKEEIQAQRDALNETNIHLERLSIVASETQNGVLIADYRGNIEWINQGYTHLLGYNLEGLKESKGLNLFFIYKSENTLQFFQKCKEEKQSVTFSSKYEKFDGSEIWLQTTITPILDDNDELKKYVVIYADITQLKEAQSQNEKYIREITASIRYASRIQNSVLPLKTQLEESDVDSFIVYKPKDIVGGDFYWFSRHGLNYMAAVVDCTGHGVPGALMTVIAYAAMNRVVNDHTAKDPAKLLQRINYEVRKMLRQEVERDDRSDDGLDMSICFIKPVERKVIFAGAKQSLYHCWSNEIDEIKGDRQSIGYVDSKEDFEYTNHEIDVRYRSIFYLSSDGFKDMPMDTDGQILGKKNFRNLLGSISLKELEEQREYLNNIIEHSGGKHENYDDITIFAFRLKE